MAEYNYPEFMPCPKCGQNAKIHAAPWPKDGMVKSANLHMEYSCPAGHQFPVYGTSLG